ncbi:MAG: MBL fold metallo-hydrolase [Treponema sp.]
MTCTVLVENSSEREDLVSQHGFSLFIETSNYTLLLDAGQDDTFARNAAVLGKDITSVSAAVCSHAHYDHAGGFCSFCSINKTAPVYTYWEPGTLCFSTARAAPGEGPRFIGWSGTDSCKDRIHVISRSAPEQIVPGVWLIPVVVHTASQPYKDKMLFIEKDGKMIPDDFSHECILAAETQKNGSGGFALFNSCSHSGVVNTLESVRHFFPRIQIFSYTGGFHFPWNRGDTIPQEDLTGMDELASYTASSGIELYSGHCTGEAALEYLEDLCGSRFHRLHTGMVFTV